MSGSSDEHIEVISDDKFIDEGEPHEIIDPVWWSVNIYDGPAKYAESLKSFSMGQRLVYAVVWYLAEVNNGGHDQFFTNSTGVVWPDALEAFETFGPAEAAKVLHEAAERFGGSPSLDRWERNTQMESLSLDFNDLDERNFVLVADIRQAMVDYIQSNRDQFYFDGVIQRPSGI